MEWLFREHFQYLCRVVYRVLPQKETVEDLVQEVFYELWRKRDGFQFRGSPRAYLRRAAINRTLNFIRDRRLLVDDDKEVDFLGQQPSAVGDLEAADLEVLLYRTIDRLPERCRIIFVLSRFDDLSYKEIAVKLGISVKTVENQISKALRLIRTAMGPYFDELP